MKINIYSKIKDGAWGGGNQFLKALKEGFIKTGNYSESVFDANTIIFNGYQDLLNLISFFFAFRGKKIVYRLGPILHLHRKGFRWKALDYAVALTANLFADLVIFQSLWSYEQALRIGFSKNKKHAIILNAVNETIFYKKEFREKIPGEKIKLVYSSWSSNMKKGFMYLKFLDEHLDFNKYEFTFIGNSPIEFKNIKMLKPLGSRELAEELRNNDIFLSPVEDDACSNALLEGLASGLPAVALGSGGNLELVKQAGALFSGEEDIMTQIDEVAKNLKSHHSYIQLQSIEEVAKKYVSAIQKLI